MSSISLPDQPDMLAPRAPGGRPTGCLALADGSLFFGQGFGAAGTAVGELCFNTAMTGYQEIMTDPSYAGQIVTFTFPHIGNVGANPEDDESADPVALGMVVKGEVTAPSNWRAAGHLSEWLARRGRIGVSGIDTRRLTRRIRDLGMPHAAMAHAADGVFDTKLRLEADLADVLMALIDTAMAESFAKGKKDNPKKAKTMKRADPPYAPALDDDDNETGETEFKFKLNAKGSSKKTGKTWANKPGLFDAKGTPLVDVEIWGGTVAKIAYHMNFWHRATDNATGVKLHLVGVQVLDLVSGGERTAENIGFEAEDGYETADPGEAGNTDVPDTDPDDPGPGTGGDDEAMF